MNVQMQKAIMLAENIERFVRYVNKNYDKRNAHLLTPDKLHQVKLLVEEYRFQVIADELMRINRFDWDEKYTSYLVNEFMKGIKTIDEFVNNHYQQLFILTARIDTLKSQGSFLCKD